MNLPVQRSGKASRAVGRLRSCAILGALLYGIAGCSPTGGGLAGLAKGAMAKLAPSPTAAPAPAATFTDATGATHRLSDFKGKVVLVNLWANWCAPCKLEIPSLAALQRAYAGRPVAVVAVSLGKGADEEAGRDFIDKNPPLVFYSDTAYRLPYAFTPPVTDIPTTILYDRKGRERARLAGGADWSGQAAQSVVNAVLAEK